jgi:hypothetical protein
MRRVSSWWISAEKDENENNNNRERIKHDLYTYIIIIIAMIRVVVTKKSYFVRRSNGEEFSVGNIGYRVVQENGCTWEHAPNT